MEEEEEEIRLLEEGDYGEDEDFTKTEGRIFPTTSFMNASTKTNDQFEEPSSDESLEFSKQYESTTFHQAARDGDCHIIEQKLKHQYRGGKRKYLKRDINLLDSMKLAPLHYAAKYGRHDAASLLIENGADLLLSGDDGCLPIHLAVKYRPEAFAQIESKVGDFEEQLTPLGVPDPRDRAKSIAITSDSFLQTLELLIQQGIPLDPEIVSADDAYGDSPLHYAVYRSNDAAAKLLLEKGADIDDCDKSNATPLHFIAKNGDNELLNLFIEFRANLSHKDDDGTTAFHHAVSGGHIQFLEVLFASIKSGRITYDGLTGDEGLTKCILERDNEDFSCLHYAIRARNTNEVLTFLLDELKRLGLKELINHQTKQTRDTVLHLAAEEGGQTVEKGIEVIRTLLKHGAKRRVLNESHETPVYLAAKNNKPKIIKYLSLRARDLLEVRDKDGWTPLMIAADQGHFEATDVLLELGADITAKDKNDRNCVFIAAKESNYKYLRHILNKNKSIASTLVNERDTYHNSPCHECCHINQNAKPLDRLKTLECLTDFGAKVDHKNDEEKTALHIAAENGQITLIRFLTNFDNKLLQDWDEEGNTALHLAAYNKRGKTVAELLNKGIQVDEVNSKGWTALDAAAAVGHLQSAKILLDHDAPVDSTDKSNVTPLHLASMNGHLEVAKYLLEQGADVRIVDTDGRNALDYAIDYYHEDIVTMFLESDEWKACLSNATDMRRENPMRPYVTPMRKLILHMPDQAKYIFNRCMEVTNHPPKSKEGAIWKPFLSATRKELESKNLQVRMNFSFIDDEFVITKYEWDKNKMRDQSSDSKSYVSMGDADPEPYDEDNTVLNENHPLIYVIESRAEELLTHPLVIALYNLKWNKRGFWIYYLNLLVYIFFMICLNIYAYESPPPYSVDFSFQFAPCVGNRLEEPIGVPILEGTAQDIWGDCYIFPPIRDNLGIICYILISFRLLLEVLEIYTSGLLSYIQEVANILEIALYVLSILFLNSVDSCYDLNELNPAHCWQWDVGATAILLSWMVLILFIRKTPVFGIYILMFVSVMKTFFQFLFIFALFIFGFALTFFMLLQNQVPFDSLPKSVMKTVVMMIGEFEYEGIFENFPEDYDPTCEDDPDCAEWNSINFTSKVSYVIFCSFIIVVTIVISNILVGLAVDDIKGVQESAILQRQAMKIRLALFAEYKLPHSYRYSLFDNNRKHVVKIGSENSFFFSWYSRFMKWIDRDSRVTRHKLKTLLSEKEDDLDEVWEEMHKLGDQVKEIQTEIGDVSENVQKMSRMLAKLLEQHNLSED
ncbi:Oidioi.mRNA.OKI2018_I69.chr2.g5330.t1.cds [Oikopleura dioica]|uniref:Oidioi.mRNA.OKI2018_I69.chr2.g5330.t1.cds n=1 Tax=Oikopleura dioica TaxID=34765 RepID=A0ABN7T959_OIKDI|nr:Oidioi.mRNA.OKI2018_I69.chr2.g5330.t1.cds [Oikopleura dioica]